MKTIKERVFANWKTSLVGVMVVYVGFAFHIGKLEFDQLKEVGTVITALILLLSKDWDKKKEAN